MSDVTREGNIVYRDLKPQSQTIHRLLLHLKGKGLQGVPRFIGVNENQEMLSFVDGETVDDYPITSDFETRLNTVKLAAKMLREYHDDTVDFERHPKDIWYLKYNGSLEEEVICHNDFAPYNVTFRGNDPIGIIDFDTACPGPRIWDIAYAVYRFVPLSMEVYVPDEKIYRKYDKTLDCTNRKLLLKAFVDAYGNIDVSAVLQNVTLRLQDLVMLFDEECRNGNISFIRMKEEGHQQLYISEIQFIKENMHDWK